MKRSPISRGKPLARRSPLTATRGAGRPRPRPRNTGPTLDVRAIANGRDGGRCVRCGKPARDLDHRRDRGTGGTHGPLADTINGPAWLLTLCGRGNTDPKSCHGWKGANKAAAQREGYAIPRNGLFVDAERVPVLVRGGRWFLYLNDGRRVPTSEPPGGDATETWAADAA